MNTKLIIFLLSLMFFVVGIIIAFIGMLKIIENGMGDNWIITIIGLGSIFLGGLGLKKTS